MRKFILSACKAVEGLAMTGCICAANPTGNHLSFQQVKVYPVKARAAFGLGISLLLASHPAQARDDGAYVTVEGGLAIMRTIEWKVSGKPNFNQTDLHTGQFDAGVVAGYDFGHLRAEGELSYQRSRMHNYVVRFPTKLNINPTIPAGFYPDATGFIHRASAMANIVAETGGNDRPGVYAGVGAGITRGRIDHFRIAGTDPFLNGSSTRPAWQVFSGVRLPLGQHVELGVKYRYQVGTGYKFTSRQGLEPFKGDIRTHSMMGTLGWNF
jgi:OOP family OmpA-OmpF porin